MHVYYITPPIQFTRLSCSIVDRERQLPARQTDRCFKALFTPLITAVRLDQSNQ